MSNNTATEQLGNIVNIVDNNENVNEGFPSPEVEDKHTTIVTVAYVDKSLHKDSSDDDTCLRDESSEDEGEMSEAVVSGRAGGHSHQDMVRGEQSTAHNMSKVSEEPSGQEKSVSPVDGSSEGQFSEDEEFESTAFQNTVFDGVAEVIYDESRSKLVTGRIPLLAVEESAVYDVSTSEMVLTRYRPRPRPLPSTLIDQEVWSEDSQSFSPSSTGLSSLSDPLPFYYIKE